MVVRLLSRLFGGGSTAPEPEPEPAPVPTPVAPVAVPAGAAGADPVALVEFLIRGLANDLERVRIESEADSSNLLIRVYCGKNDMGRVIGKNGKTIGAIRHLATDAAARNKIRLRKIEIVEP